MKKSKWLVLVLLLFIHFNCTYIKMGSIFLGGKLEKVNFKEEIDCVYQGQLIFIDVTINQSNKPLRFILDTGAALCVVSEAIAAQSGIKTSVRDEISDATRKKGTIGFGKIPLVTIGKIPFKNIGTAIMNVDKTAALKCYRIDGVIGANLMRLVPIWQIDYKNQKIVFTDNLRFKSPAKTDLIIPFEKNRQRIPEVELKINNELRFKSKVDLGSAHGIVMPLKEWKKIKASSPDIVFAKGYGEGSSGALGSTLGEGVVAKVKDFYMGNTLFESQFMEFYPDVYTSIGNTFFEKYTFTLNWKEKKIMLSPMSAAIQKETLSGFGFSYSYNIEKKRLYVSFIYENSPAEKGGLKIGDQILAINDRELENLSLVEYCELFFRPDLLMNTDSLLIVIKWKEHEQKIILSPAVLIE